MIADLASRLGLLARPLLLALDAEAAHRLTIRALAVAPRLSCAPDDSRLATTAFGLAFPNPLGLAAGFDKNAEVPDAMLALGFGFVEVGTLTPRPQPGNPKPRIFRLARDEAVINRLGFNNEGHAAGRERLARRGGAAGVGIVGVNIGANKDASDRAADYVAGIRAFSACASYFTVNVSSPNTPGLRDLQQEAVLDDLIARVIAERDRAAEKAGRRPVLLKIAPDLSLPELDGIIRVARRRAIDGLIVANTTVARPASLIETATGAEAGGLSGRPLFGPSTALLAQAYLRAEGAFPLVGVGGIDSAAAAWTKITAGATLVQLYTALVYKGPGLVGEIKRGLVAQLAQSGLAGLGQAVGSAAPAMARGD